MESTKTSAAEEGERWLDRKTNIKKIYKFVWILCGLLILIEPFVHKHATWEFDSLLGFYGVFGFVGCVALVLIAKVLRIFLKRPENFYD
jgi:hypothetical protein